MYVENITSNGVTLNSAGKSMQIEVYEKRIKELEEENKKLKNVINELSKHLVTTFNKTQNTDYLDIKIKLDALVKGGENEKN